MTKFMSALFLLFSVHAGAKDFMQSKMRYILEYTNMDMLVNPVTTVATVDVIVRTSTDGAVCKMIVGKEFLPCPSPGFLRSPVPGYPTCWYFVSEVTNADLYRIFEFSSLKHPRVEKLLKTGKLQANKIQRSYLLLGTGQSNCGANFNLQIESQQNPSETLTVGVLEIEQFRRIQ